MDSETAEPSPSLPDKSSDVGSLPTIVSEKKGSNDGSSPACLGEKGSDDGSSPSIVSEKKGLGEKSSDVGSPPSIVSEKKSSDVGSPPSIVTDKKSSDAPSPSSIVSENKSSTQDSSSMLSTSTISSWAKTPASTESANNSSASAQSGAIESFTKGIVDSSLNAVKAVQVKARHIVSQNKRRYQGFYRNHMEEVIKFFETHHKVGKLPVPLVKSGKKNSGHNLEAAFV
ncbi:UNVERIFIED_CONTAM: Phosphatidylinositol 3,4,5-trisphosphate 3-phosphatase and protein-tyrosine-phosphatase PTEN2B [Sesamum angustifolium]|uniref:Phosphatidylinositol 3,4,5-trisphosphate 3-phosphatase and protein-tyrosine-phosphatase PTEN2B n=1 Tax=Sesamum angustifolium TaxID=2727405 RepID=A0AAW2NJT4_9LAMI